MHVEGAEQVEHDELGAVAIVSARTPLDSSGFSLCAASVSFRRWPVRFAEAHRTA
jgi:hypothetical protein